MICVRPAVANLLCFNDFQHSYDNFIWIIYYSSSLLAAHRSFICIARSRWVARLGNCHKLDFDADVQFAVVEISVYFCLIIQIHSALFSTYTQKNVAHNWYQWKNAQMRNWIIAFKCKQRGRKRGMRYEYFVEKYILLCVCKIHECRWTEKHHGGQWTETSAAIYVSRAVPQRICWSKCTR